MNNQSKPQVVEQLREYLQAIVAVMKQSKKETSKYSGFQELILDYGRFMEPKPLPKNIKRGQPRSCYYNCQQLALKHSNLTYVEGFAIAADVSFPLAHAWLLSPDGYALDPTWETSGNCYLGIPFSTQWVKSVVKLRTQQGHADILSIFEGNYLEDFSLLKDGFTT
ncbi:hypothetical protein [Kamptonema sp. UHCC 0994]|uniref:hypothetical protein n=1 Tax=Kamptonema sp. UHCC 0994 TaxID=3031329 RepID=UPI0023BA93D9|nr:hypothetical protein [Kamptonema sp. UHCC 0994]MDF0556402.1 hypothetical protein [Kamptonema sp. UHCC 0994]